MLARAKVWRVSLQSVTQKRDDASVPRERPASVACCSPPPCLSRRQHSWATTHADQDPGAHAMDPVLTDATNSCAVHAPAFDDSSSDCTTISSVSLCSPSSTLTTDADQDQSSASNEGDSSTGAKRRRRRRRLAPPPIFFGTPSAAGHERQTKYETKMRTRRLLRRDSLELARRKSTGAEAVKAAPVGRHDHETAVTEQEADSAPAARQEATPVSPSRSFSDEGTTNRSPGRASSNWESEASDSSEGSSSEELSTQAACDRTIRLSDECAAVHVCSDDTSSAAESSSQAQAPSTPIKQGAWPVLARPSPAFSDADSSPGVALGVHSTPARPSPLSQLSPAMYGETAHVQSPFAHSPLKTDGAEGMTRGHQYLPDSSRSARVLRENAGKANQSTSPAQTPFQSSPNKAVVVRQTLSAWAHARLKTPQSPEKREWDMMRSEATSPVRAAQSARRPGSVNLGQPVRSSDQMSCAPRPLMSTAASSPRKDAVRPLSRIARPVPVSRLPRPAAVGPSESTVKRIATTAAAEPLRRLAGSASHAGPSAAPHRAVASIGRPAMRVSGPFRSSGPGVVKAAARAGMAGNLHSPAKEERLRPGQRALGPSSSPLKQSTTVKGAPPIVRDARLIAAPKRRAEQVATAPASSPIKTATATALPVIPAAQPASSGGVGAARRVAVDGSVSGQASVRHQRKGLHSKDVMMISRPSAAEEECASPQRESLTAPLRRYQAGQEQEQAVVPAKVAPLELQRDARQPQREGEKRSKVKTRKPTPSSVLFPSSPRLSLSKAELSRLTSLHTRRNEAFVSQLETVVLRKRGETRPVSPSSKIRRSSGDGEQRQTKEAAREARERRARKRTPEVGNDGGDKMESEPGGHRLGAGEEVTYVSPPRNRTQAKSVRWHRALFCGPSDERPSTAEAATATTPADARSLPRRSCLAGMSVALDRLGNVAHANHAFSPHLAKNKVIVYKLVYDDDE